MIFFANWLKQNGWFILLFIAAIIITLEIFLWDYQGILSNRIIAWATILLAIATVMLAIVTVNEGKKSRKNQRDREDRERKERFLKEIIDWAIDIINEKYHTELIKLRTLLQITVTAQQADSQQLEYLKTEILGRNKYFIKIASSIDNDLKTSVEQLSNSLNNLADQIQLNVHSPYKNPIDRFKVVELANIVIVKASDLL